MLRTWNHGHIRDADNPMVISRQQKKATGFIGNHFFQQARQLLGRRINPMLAKLLDQKLSAFTAIAHGSGRYGKWLYGDGTHRPKAEVSDGGGQETLEFAKQRRPSPFAPP